MQEIICGTLKTGLNPAGYVKIDRIDKVNILNTCKTYMDIIDALKYENEAVWQLLMGPCKDLPRRSIKDKLHGAGANSYYTALEGVLFNMGRLNGHIMPDALQRDFSSRTMNLVEKCTMMVSDCMDLVIPGSDLVWYKFQIN